MKRDIFEADHDAFRDSVRAFCEKEIAPNHDQWEKDGIVPRELWEKAGEMGLLGFMMPEEYGGGGIDDFRFNAVLDEELIRVGASGVGFVLHTDLVSGYLLAYASEEQKKKWLPKICTGDIVGAIAMTEPGTGSDLQAVRSHAARGRRPLRHQRQQDLHLPTATSRDLVIVVAKTGNSGEGAKDISLIVVEAGTPGFTKGKPLKKIGMHAQDTCELFFDNVRVPKANLLGRRKAWASSC